MPNEDSGDTPSSDPKNQPSPETPMSQSTPEQDEMRQESERHASSEETATVKLERYIKTGEIWLIVINGLLLITNIVIACIYYGQLTQMREATRATKSAADTANATLKELEKGGTDTHDLAVAAKKQAQVAQDAITLQTKVAAAVYGADVTLGALYVRHEGKQVRAILRLVNSGKSNAESVSVAAKLGFSIASLRDKDFELVNKRPGDLTIRHEITNGPAPRIPPNESYYDTRTTQISPAQYAVYERSDTNKVYVRIVINYKVFGYDVAPVKYCKYAPTKAILQATGGEERKDYTGSYEDCLE